MPHADLSCLLSHSSARDILPASSPSILCWRLARTILARYQRNNASFWASRDFTFSSLSLFAHDFGRLSIIVFHIAYVHECTDDFISGISVRPPSAFSRTSERPVGTRRLASAQLSPLYTAASFIDRLRSADCGYRRRRMRVIIIFISLYFTLCFHYMDVARRSRGGFKKLADGFTQAFISGRAYLALILIMA